LLLNFQALSGFNGPNEFAGCASGDFANQLRGAQSGLLGCVRREPSGKPSAEHAKMTTVVVKELTRMRAAELRTPKPQEAIDGACE
jgi:hypothetical protein